MSDTHAANRREDLRLITGRGRYTADWNLPGQLHAGFLRSDRAHAEIVSLNVKPALECRGVVAVFTGADALAAGYTQFPTLLTFTGRGGTTLLKTERPVLAAGKVRFVGETVAMVVAESALAAQDALGAIEIEYNDLPPAVTVEDALAAGAPQLHANVPGNLCFEWESGDAAAVAKAFEQAAHVTRLKPVTTRVAPSPMEPRACLISYDAASDSYDIYTCSQGINMLRRQFSVLTGVPEEKLRLHLHDVGGSFGQRSAVYPEHAAQMIAAKKLGRPVKWVSSRSEGFLSDSHGRGIDITGELALDRDGRFLAARYQFECDMGAYLTPTGCVSHLRNPATCMTGVYRIPALYGSFKVVLTNTAPIAAYRGAGRPDIAYVVERLVDKAASELKIDRDELRRRNFIPLDAFPYKTPTRGVYEQSDFAGCLDKALKAADWSGFEPRRAAARKARQAARHRAGDRHRRHRRRHVSQGPGRDRIRCAGQAHGLHRQPVLRSGSRNHVCGDRRANARRGAGSGYAARERSGQGPDRQSHRRLAFAGRRRQRVQARGAEADRAGQAARRRGTRARAVAARLRRRRISLSAAAKK